MATIGGPNTEKDNLVFGFDSGYGVADNNTATRFYPGESTENLVGNPTFIGTSGTQTQGVNPANWVFSGETGSTGFQFYNSGTSPIPLKFPNEGAVITTGSGTSNRRIYFRREDLLGNTTYTISCWMYFSNAFSSNWSKFQYDSSNTSLGGGYFDTFANYASANGYGLNEWFLWKGTLTTEATTAKCYWGPVISSGANVLVGMQRMQVETKGHVTPFVNGTRSSTQSLIDLKKTTNIDVSNVSFNSTGQPTFDGTDDSLTIPGSLYTTSDTKTIEIGFKMNGSYSNYSPLAIYANGSSSTNRIWLGLQNNKFKMHGWGTDDPTGTTTILSDEWYICTFSYNKSTQAMKMYTNGVLESSTTNSQSGVTAVSNMNWYLGTIPGGYQGVTYSDVDIPIFKIHNTILTDLEVKQNYNAYKNRFDI